MEFFLSLLLTPLSRAENLYVPLQSMRTSFDASDEKPGKFKDDAHAVSTREVDTAAELVSGDQSELDPKEALRVRCVSVKLTKGKLLTSLGGRSIFILCLSCVVSFFECFVVSQTDKLKVLYWLVRSYDDHKCSNLCRCTRIQFMDKTTLGSAAILGIRCVSCRLL